jgi:hypothetical protein
MVNADISYDEIEKLVKRNQINNMKPVCTAFIDLEKAFD